MWPPECTQTKKLTTEDTRSTIAVAHSEHFVFRCRRVKNKGSRVMILVHSTSLSCVRNTVKPVFETTCIKRPSALRDYCSDTTNLLKSTLKNLHLRTTCCKRPLSLLPLSGL